MWRDLNAAPKKCFIGCPHLTVDVVREIKERCGEDFPIIYRIDLTQGLQESYGDEVYNKNFRGMERTIEEGVELCRILAEAGWYCK